VHDNIAAMNQPYYAFYFKTGRKHLTDTAMGVLKKQAVGITMIVGITRMVLEEKNVKMSSSVSEQNYVTIANNPGEAGKGEYILRKICHKRVNSRILNIETR